MRYDTHSDAKWHKWRVISLASFMNLMVTHGDPTHDPTRRSPKHDAPTLRRTRKRIVATTGTQQTNWMDWSQSIQNTTWHKRQPRLFISWHDSAGRPRGTPERERGRKGGREREREERRARARERTSETEKTIYGHYR